MLHLTRVIDKAVGCVFVPAAANGQPADTVDASHLPASQRPNAYALMTSAAGAPRGLRADVRDVQERWIDARDEWDEWERAQWHREGVRVREEEARQKQQKSKIRERTAGAASDGRTAGPKESGGT